MSYFHSVTLDKEKCQGCTNCIKRCPTEAIRVRNGKAKIIKERCIDCGECIRVCPYHAKLAVTDGFGCLKEFKYNIALPAPSFYGQFRYVDDRNKVLTAFTSVGFNSVFEVAKGAEYVSIKTEELLKNGKIKKPLISSACSAVVRLIRERFPDLINNISDLLSPMETAAMLARREAKIKTGMSDSEIGVFFITPCPAKVTSIKAPLTLEKSYISGAISATDAYVKLRPFVKSMDNPRNLSAAGNGGVAWARSGGECEASGTHKYIAVDGINNVINVLSEIEDDKLDDIDFVELCACTNGCVGGPLNITNSFVATTRINNMIKGGKPLRKGEYTEDISRKKKITAAQSMKLDEDLEHALEKMEKIEKMYADMPKLDCGSCGAPSCRALAEDIVRGFASENDCIFKMRERVRELANELFCLDSDSADLHDKNTEGDYHDGKRACEKNRT